MTNLLEETIHAVKDSGHKIDQIIFIGSLETGHRCSWDEFQKLADFGYNNGFGWAKVPTDLVVAFDDQTYMTRGEYDGSEWWQYLNPLKIPEESKSIKTLEHDSGWRTIEEINDD
ncbi:MAG: hypothetical protein AAFW75_27145 [Cyanobacteria bacterium J06636_16]